MDANVNTLRQQLKAVLGPQWTVRLRCLMRGKPFPRWGNLRRTRPFSTNFGFDRGTPIDRYYLGKFLERHRTDIRGQILEIQGLSYTRRYGHDIRVAHSVDVNPAVRPTFVCDLANSDHLLPSASYDCFLLPNTLQHLRDLEGSLRAALRIVRPGGVILASGAAFVPLIPDGPDFWRLSLDGWKEVAGRVWPGIEVVVESHGNCLTAVAAMLGIAVEELRTEELEMEDPRYPVLVTLFCRKPGGNSDR